MYTPRYAVEVYGKVGLPATVLIMCGFRYVVAYGVVCNVLL